MIIAYEEIRNELISRWIKIQNKVVGFTLTSIKGMVALAKLDQVFIDGTFQSFRKLLHYTNYLVY